jgi:signal transduction histidine kinase
LAGTPTEEKQKKRIQLMINQKDEKINEFREILRQLQPDLEQILVELSNSDFNKDQKTKFDYQQGFDLSEHNIE